MVIAKLVFVIVGVVALGGQSAFGGGEEANLGEYPWSALIHYSKPGTRGRFLCGGTLINKNYVITAAQCIHTPTLRRTGYAVDYVRLGEWDLRSENDCEEGKCADPVVNVPVSEMIAHENYNGRAKTYDIALLRLLQDIKFTDWIQPIALPSAQHSRNKVYDDSPLVVVNFGQNANAIRSDVKLKQKVNGVNLDYCNNAYRRHSTILSDMHLCAAATDEGDECGGQSGDSLVGEDLTDSMKPVPYLAGIVSFGPRVCSTTHIPDVYTRVDQYLDWISNHMKP